MSNVEWVEDESTFDELLKNDRVVVDFSAPAWCRPCQQLEPHFEKAASQMMVDSSVRTKFVAVDVDKAPWAMERFGVQSVPTVMLFEAGSYIKNIVGRTVVQILSELR